MVVETNHMYGFVTHIKRSETASLKHSPFEIAVCNRDLFDASSIAFMRTNYIYIFVKQDQQGLKLTIA